VAARRKSTPGALVLRAVIVLLALGVVVFAVQGGEWGTFDLIRQKSRLARVRHAVDSLKHEVDSLKKYKQAVLTDPVIQEKIAREEFGMVRGNKEILYRYTEPEAGSRVKAAGSRKPEAAKKVP
jgi:cell division protein FtsB